MKPSRDIIYISEHIAKTISFPDLLESEVGAKIKWSRNMETGLGNCPMPDHRDNNASFRINLMDSGMWVYHCFGCGRSGTIISFCKEFYGLPNKLEAIVWICKKYNIQNSEDLILQGIKNISKRVDMQRMVENENMRVSNLCKMLLRKSFDKNKDWVMKAYKTLNECMDNEDIETITKIGEEASKMMKGNNENNSKR